MNKEFRDSLLRSFDEPPSRIKTDCVKWDKRLHKFGREDIIPLWVADMDFAAPAAVREALQHRLSHGIYGYTFRTRGYIESVVNWLSRRYQWKVSVRDLIFYPPGTVAAVNMLVNLLTQPEDEVIVQVPSYPPLMNIVRNNNRRLIENPLVLTDNGYKMDLELLESQVSDKTKLLILCSPHNPTGRVWSKETLAELARICLRHNIKVVSDEIHADLTRPGIKHCHFNALPQSERPSSVTIISTCKSFNLAGLPQSTLICDDQNLRKKIQQQVDNSQVNLDSLFVAIATEAAYSQGEEWLDCLREYLYENRTYLESFLKDNIPKIRLLPAQGTYLAWLDCRALGLPNAQLQDIFIHQAKVGLYDGLDFGRGGEGFFRLNFACSRSLLDKALNQIKTAIDKL
ncbi:MalY/PatB family protein [Aliikangiella sp. G2MR2-5]|uniref:MalY/PatB family protein n=1 Tax=Aliikangiella sp. G2MR2-5 TaxID=2788943 RepID=UPI0018A8D60B|nr:PatB family C-S lyase [Aliikangiella sp. G2MR2-5]